MFGVKVYRYSRFEDINFRGDPGFLVRVTRMYVKPIVKQK